MKQYKFTCTRKFIINWVRKQTRVSTGEIDSSIIAEAVFTFIFPDIKDYSIDTFRRTFTSTDNSRCVSVFTDTIRTSNLDYGPEHEIETVSVLIESREPITDSMISTVETIGFKGELDSELKLGLQKERRRDDLTIAILIIILTTAAVGLFLFFLTFS